jgi:hypothetical protein
MSAERLQSQQRELFLGNGSAIMPNARQWLGSHHVMATEDLLDVVFPVQSIPRLYNGDQLPLHRLKTAGRRVGDWCEMAESL